MIINVKVNMLIKEDFPTLERPINAYSGKRSNGHLLTSELLIINSAVLIFIYCHCEAQSSPAISCFNYK